MKEITKAIFSIILMMVCIVAILFIAPVGKPYLEKYLSKEKPVCTYDNCSQDLINKISASCDGEKYVGVEYFGGGKEIRTEKCSKGTLIMEIASK
ncbi:hypothetical protein ES702_02753 [subsurface metagenome]